MFSVPSWLSRSQADATHDSEVNAATNIQRLFRGSKLRAYITTQSCVAVGDGWLRACAVGAQQQAHWV